MAAIPVIVLNGIVIRGAAHAIPKHARRREDVKEIEIGDRRFRVDELGAPISAGGRRLKVIVREKEKVRELRIADDLASDHQMEWLYAGKQQAELYARDGERSFHVARNAWAIIGADGETIYGKKRRKLKLVFQDRAALEFDGSTLVRGRGYAIKGTRAALGVASDVGGHLLLVGSDGKNALYLVIDRDGRARGAGGRTVRMLKRSGGVELL